MGCIRSTVLLHTMTVDNQLKQDVIIDTSLSFFEEVYRSFHFFIFCNSMCVTFSTPLCRFGLTGQAIELNNGRAAQMGILGLMMHEAVNNHPYIINDLVRAGA